MECEARWYQCWYEIIKWEIIFRKKLDISSVSPWASVRCELPGAMVKTDGGVWCSDVNYEYSPTASLNNILIVRPETPERPSGDLHMDHSVSQWVSEDMKYCVQTDRRGGKPSIKHWTADISDINHMVRSTSLLLVHFNFNTDNLDITFQRINQVSLAVYS